MIQELFVKNPDKKVDILTPAWIVRLLQHSARRRWELTFGISEVRHQCYYRSSDRFEKTDGVTKRTEHKNR